MVLKKLEGPISLKELEVISGDEANLLTASSFKAKSVACVALKEKSFRDVLFGFEGLGFEVACSSSLEAIFETVSDGPEDWAMIVVRLDQPLNEDRLESFVRLMRMMEVRIPIMIMLENGKTPKDSGYSRLYADCVVGEPKSQVELSNALKVAVNANLRWGSRFDDFRREAVNRLCGPQLS